MPGARLIRSSIALVAVLLAVPGVAQATPVATDPASYAALGAVFPDPMAGCGTEPCSPHARGNAPATQFIQWEEFLDALEFMNTQNGTDDAENWARYMEVLVLDGKLGEGSHTKAEVEEDPTRMFPGNDRPALEFAPDPAYVSAGLPQTTFGRARTDLVVVRVTDETVPDEGKKRYALSLSIHGIERAGAEGGTRAMEDLVTAFTTGRADEAILPEGVKEGGPTPTFAEALRTTIVYFTYPNPDGWRRGSLYDTSSGPGVFFQRYNGNGIDPNRDWPDIGFTFRPYSGGSEPETKAFTGFYDGVRQVAPFTAGDDLHGMSGADALSYTMLPHGRHDLGKDARIRATAMTINRSTAAAVSWSPYVKPNDEISNPDNNPDTCAPVPIYEYCTAIYPQTWGTVYDTINYTTAGTLSDWYDSRLGLQADGMANEMAFSHLDKNIVFDPHTEQLHVDGNKALIWAHIADMHDPVGGEMDAPGPQGYVPNARLVREEQEVEEGPPPGTQPQDDIQDEFATPDPEEDGQAVYEFTVQRGPEIFSGGMRVDATVPNFQGVATGSATMSVECLHCDDHVGYDPAASDEWVTIAEDYNQAGPPLPLYAQAGLTASVNAPQSIFFDDDGKPQAVQWRVVVGLVDAGPVGPVEIDIDFTSGPASTDGNTGGDPAPKLLGYDVANTDFFEDLNDFIPDPADDFVTVDPRDVIENRQKLDELRNLVLADTLLPGYTGLYEGDVADVPDAASEGFTFANKGATVPGDQTDGCKGDTSTETHDFTIPATDDNRLVRARIEWADFRQDWDLFLLRKNEDDEYEEVDSATSFNVTTGDPSETVEAAEPAPGDWRVEVRNCTATDPAYTGEVTFEPFEAPPPSEYTPEEKGAWVAALREYVEGGGNLVLTDAALQGGLAELTDIPFDAVNRQTVYAGQMTFRRAANEPTLDDPLARNVNQPGSRFNTGMRRQIFEPTPLGFAIQNSLTGADESFARQYDVAAAAFTEAGGRIVATSVNSGARNAAAVLGRVTMGEIAMGEGTLRIAGALLPQPSTEYDHPLGLEPFALTYTGYIVVCNLLDAECRTTRAAPPDDDDDDDDRAPGDGGGGGGTGGPTDPPRPPGGTEGDAGSNPTACASRAGFRSTSVSPAERGRGVRMRFLQRVGAPASVDVFQVSLADRIITREWRVAEFPDVTDSFTWDGRSTNGKRVRDGVFFVRFRTAGIGRRDWRRHTLVRRGGRFFARRTFYRPDSCGFLSSAKLHRPVFGGRQAFPLRAAFRTSRRADATITVRRGRRVVQRITMRDVRARRTHRIRFRGSGRSWARGLHRVTIAVRSGSRRAAATLYAERL